MERQVTLGRVATRMRHAERCEASSEIGSSSLVNPVRVRSQLPKGECAFLLERARCSYLDGTRRCGGRGGREIPAPSLVSLRERGASAAAPLFVGVKVRGRLPDSAVS